MAEKVTYKIEKGIPIPPPNNKMKLPFADLEVGDSFLIPHEKGDAVGKKISVRATAARKKFPERDFIVRRVEGGTRIWRVKKETNGAESTSRGANKAG